MSDEARAAARRIDEFDPSFPKYHEWNDDLVQDAKTVARALLATAKADTTSGRRVVVRNEDGGEHWFYPIDTSSAE